MSAGPRVMVGIRNVGEGDIPVANTAKCPTFRMQLTSTAGRPRVSVWSAHTSSLFMMHLTVMLHLMQKRAEDVWILLARPQHVSAVLQRAESTGRRGQALALQAE